MKVKVYAHDGKMEAKSNGGVVIRSKATESMAVFIDRVKRFVADEYLIAKDDIEIVEITRAVMAENDDSVLLAAYEGSTGLQRQLMYEVLVERRLVGMARIKRTPVVPQTKEAIMATEEYKAFELNVGKWIEFVPSRHPGTMLTGEIKGVFANKTNTKAYYYVTTVDKVRTCTATDNPTMKFVKAPAKKPKGEKTK